MDNDFYYVHESSYIDEGAIIGEGTKIWFFCHIQSDSIIGKNCVLGQNVFVCKGCKIGNGVKIQNNVSVYECVELEDYVFCGPSVVFTNDYNPRAKYKKGSQGYRKTLVKEGATIGANATIVCGNTIGNNAMVAAGSVVTHDVPDFALVQGIPARQVGWVCECGSKLSETASGYYICSSCGREYCSKDGGKLKFLRKVDL